MRAAHRTPIPFWLGAFGLLCAPIALAFRTWRAWGDPTIDFPHQLYISWRVAEGDVLYRDIEYVYGPASQWINGAIFRIFGVSYLHQVLANLAFSLAICFLIIVFFRRAFGQLTAVAGTLSFVLIHMFQHAEPYGCFNFLGPYCHEAVHGTLLLLTLVFLCARAPGERWSLLIQGFVLGTLFLMKPEFLLAGGAILLTSFALGGIPLRRAGFVGAAFLAPLLGSLVYFLGIGGLSLMEALRATLASLVPLLGYGLANSPFYAAALGTDILGTRLLEMAGATLAIGCVLGVAALLDKRLEGKSLRKAGVLYLFLLAGSFLRVSALGLSHAWSVLCVGGLVWCFRERTRLPKESARAALLLGVWAVVLSLKVFFNPVFTMFGFYLLVPATLFLCVVGTRLLPELLAAARPGAFVLRGSALVLLGAISFQGTVLALRFYDQKNLVIGSGDDSFLAFDQIGIPGTASARLVKEAVARVERLTPPHATVMAVPEGLLVNYLLRRKNPTPFLQSFILRTLYGFSGGTRAILERLEKSPPDYLFYLHRAPEFPGPAFQMRGPGGFAEDSFRWIEAKFEEVDRIGPRSNDFGELLFVLWKRKTP